jgi:hypothetical protein
MDASVRARTSSSTKLFFRESLTRPRSTSVTHLRAPFVQPPYKKSPTVVLMAYSLADVGGSYIEPLKAMRRVATIPADASAKQPRRTAITAKTLALVW